MDDDKTPKTKSQEQQEIERYSERLKKLFGPLWENIKSESKTAKFWLELLALIGVLVYAGIAAFQWGAMRESNKINRDSLTSVQRAFLTFDRVQQNRLLNRSQSGIIDHRWSITAIINNDGTTPAIGAVNFLGVDALSGEPDEREFKGSTENLIATTIRPKAAIGLGPIMKNEASLFGRDLGK